MEVINIEKLLNSKINNITQDPYNHEYNAWSFNADNCSYKFRSAKITPSKAGGFVVMWIKNNDMINTPYHFDNFPNFLIVEISEMNHQGYFIFPKDILRRKKILSSNGTLGKMAFRVYPSWSSCLNSTASKSKEWQNEYFHHC